MNERRAWNLKEVIADTSLAQATDMFSADFQLAEGTKVRITIMESVGAIWNLVPSAGTSIPLNAGGALTALDVYTEEITLDKQRTWNLQTPTSGGATLHHVVVQEVQI